MTDLDSAWARQRLAAGYTIEYQSSRGEQRFRLLRGVRSGRSIEVFETSDRHEFFCAALARNGLRRRWRRTVPGAWLVLRCVYGDGSQPKARYRHEATKLGAAEGYRFFRPHSMLSQELDEAEARPMPEQLSACGWTMVARTADGWAELYEGERLPVVLYLVEDGTARLLRHGRSLVRWNTRTTNRLYEEDHSLVPVPLGLDSSSWYTGGLDDLLEFHPTGHPGEGGSTGSYTWRMPDFHYHTSDGAVVCTELDAKNADQRNDPWPVRDEPLGPGPD